MTPSSPAEANLSTPSPTHNSIRAEEKESPHTHTHRLWSMRASCLTISECAALKRVSGKRRVKRGVETLKKGDFCEEVDSFLVFGLF